MQHFFQHTDAPVALNVLDLHSGTRGFDLAWDDQTSSQFPYIFLRDNDPDELHPQTQERLFDLASVALEIAPVSFELTTTGLTICWPGKPEPSVYPLSWLYRYRPGMPYDDPAKVSHRLWDAQFTANIPRANAHECARSPTALRRALLDAKSTGLIIVEGLEDSETAGETFGDLIGFKRTSNFGITFDVRSSAQPNNLAFTAIALPLHADLANQDHIPGFQFLHCIRNDAGGGDSVFADGFRICADLAQTSPQVYDLLRKVPVPWRFLIITACCIVARPTIRLPVTAICTATTSNTTSSIVDYECWLAIERTVLLISAL